MDYGRNERKDPQGDPQGRSLQALPLSAVLEVGCQVVPVPALPGVLLLVTQRPQTANAVRGHTFFIRVVLVFYTTTILYFNIFLYKQNTSITPHNKPRPPANTRKQPPPHQPQNTAHPHQHATNS